MLETDAPLASATPRLSIVIPVRDEADNVGSLAQEISDVLSPRCRFEIIFVDDASTDSTAEEVRHIQRAIPETRLLRHTTGCGQSIAVLTGVRAARADWIVTLDGDGQNDPVDIPVLLQALERGPDDLKLVMGNRQLRKDTWLRRLASRVANGVRRRMLHDDTPDTGCGIKLFDRVTYLQLPAFDHMHRFLPALFQRAGVRVISVSVRHRARIHGRSKYGIADRLWVGMVDLFGVRWLIKRAGKRPEIVEDRGA